MKRSGQKRRQVAALQRLPLEKMHEQLGAGFSEQDGWRVPATYGDSIAEYAAVREDGAGVIDLSSRGRIRVSGSEALMFLNGLITNDMKTLNENHWMPAAFPTVQGRLIAAVRVVRGKDDVTGNNGCLVFLLDTEATTRHQVLNAIERFTLAGDFRVTDVTNDTSLLSVQGKWAPEVLGKVFNASIADIPRDGVWETSRSGQSVTVIRASHTAENGFDVVSNSETGTALWQAIIEAGARPVGHEALEILRVEAGIARYGRDMDETNVITETTLDDAVSFTKGCYIGQEIIIRIKHRGHVAKKLCGLTLDNSETVESGAILKGTDGKEIGYVTSAVVSPSLGRTIALGYVRYEYLTPGTMMKVSTGAGEANARVEELPFVRGSWYDYV